ncbi:MAG: DnaJ domain-containing protein [Clostridia bacterium]|nr:DnaJ domain-containing protein [Clostridia bacterium]
MIKNKNFYEILQVQYDADAEVIDAAYRRLCKKYHPDLCKESQASEMIIHLNLAHETLSDPIKREAYDIRYLSTKLLKKTDSRIEESKEILSSYIIHLKKEEFEKAYLLLSAKDKRNIPENKFIEWQSEVSKVYSIGNHDIKFFRKEISKKIEMYEFDVTIREKLIRDNTIQNYSFSKKVIYEKGLWKILLDYQEVDSFISRFYIKSIHEQYNNEVKKEILSYKHFLNAVKMESERFMRYNRIYSIAMISLNESAVKEELKKYLHSVIKITSKNLRMLDSVGLFKNNVIVVLLPETKFFGAKKVCDKLSKLFKESGEINRHNCQYKFSICECKDENYHDTIKRCYLLLK